MRELTKNEKVLLNILGIILIGWGTYQFIITPQYRRLESFNTQKLEYQEQIDEVTSILSREDDINRDLDILMEEKDEIVSGYFPTLHQPQAIYLLNDLLAKDEITITDMEFDKPTYEELEELQVKNMILSISYEGTYRGVIDVIKAIKNSPRNILVESVFMERDPEGRLEGDISLKIYGLDDMVDADRNVIKINDLKRDLGRTPFSVYSGYSEERSSASESEPTDPSPDNVPGELDVLQGLNPYSPGFSVDYEKENEMSLIPDEGVK